MDESKITLKTVKSIMASLGLIGVMDDISYYTLKKIICDHIEPIEEVVKKRIEEERENKLPL